MQKTVFRHLFAILSGKVSSLLGFLLIFLGASFVSQAQINLYEHDEQTLYFGISLGGNSSDYIIKLHENFPLEDTILVADNSLGPGFSLGIASNLKLGKRLAIRFIPALTFAEKHINFTTFDGQVNRTEVSNIYLDFPINLKYKSDRWGNVRLYTLTGIKYSYDLNSNARNRKSEDLIKALKHDVSAELGLGASVFFSNFVLAPEFKASHGLINVHSRDETKAHSRSIAKLRSRSYSVTINLEGGGRLIKKKKKRRGGFSK